MGSGSRACMSGLACQGLAAGCEFFFTSILQYIKSSHYLHDLLVFKYYNLWHLIVTKIQLFFYVWKGRDKNKY